MRLSQKVQNWLGYVWIPCICLLAYFVFVNDTVPFLSILDGVIVLVIGLLLLIDTTPTPSFKDALLSEAEVEWVVNSHADLGVLIKGICYFLYKGESLVYFKEGEPLFVRKVEKREFGESAHPLEHPFEAPLDKPYLKGEGWTQLRP